MDPLDTPRQARAERKAALRDLLTYARTHHHSRFWIPALMTILAQKGVARG